MQVLIGMIWPVLVAGAAGSPPKAELASLEGIWVNVDRDTRGLTKLRISTDGNQWWVEGWGKCHPTDCEWGKVPLHLVAQSVASKEYTHAFAVWEAGFKTSYLIIQIRGNGILVQIISIFKDRSGRSNYISTYFLQRIRP